MLLSASRKPGTLCRNNMVTQTKHNISSETATDLLKNGQPLIGSYVEGEIKIEIRGSWSEEVVIENCVIEYFSV